MAKTTEKESNLERFRPKKAENAKRSSYFPKEELFTKHKTYLNKAGKQEIQKADWCRIALGGKTIELVKGEAVLESELALFNDAAKAHYLVKAEAEDDKAAKAAKKAADKAAKEAADKAAKEAADKAAKEAADKAAKEADGLL